MSVTLSDAANWAQILSLLSLPLSVGTWLCTRERFSEFWTKRLSLIFGLLALLTVIVLWHLGWMGWLSTEVSWPVWAMILLVLSVPAVGLFGLWVHSLTERQPERPDWRRYVSDCIFGVQWQWGYYTDNGLNDSELSAFCPHEGCKCRLEIRTVYGLYGQMYGQGVELACNHCQFKQVYEYDWDTLKRKVIIEIERRVRTGEFATRLQLGRAAVNDL